MASRRRESASAATRRRRPKRGSPRRTESPNRPKRSEAPAAMPRGPPRGISVSSRRGWGPGASEKKLVGWSLASESPKRIGPPLLDLLQHRASPREPFSFQNRLKHIDEPIAPPDIS